MQWGHLLALNGPGLSARGEGVVVGGMVTAGMVIAGMGSGHVIVSSTHSYFFSLVIPVLGLRVNSLVVRNGRCFS